MCFPSVVFYLKKKCSEWQIFFRAFRVEVFLNASAKSSHSGGPLGRHQVLKWCPEIEGDFCVHGHSLLWFCAFPVLIFCSGCVSKIQKVARARVLFQDCVILPGGNASEKFKKNLHCLDSASLFRTVSFSFLPLERQGKNTLSESHPTRAFPHPVEKVQNQPSL